MAAIVTNNLNSGMIMPQVRAAELVVNDFWNVYFRNHRMRIGMARTGRPRGFDRNEAVAHAMNLFWEHGFEGASLDQLRRAMGGISSASFYAAFGSKEALYREALDTYLNSHGTVMQALHDGSLAPRERLERAMRRSAVMQTAPSHPAGCMVTLSATICSEGGASVQAVTAAERMANREAIRDCVQAAVDDGTLGAETDAEGLAALFAGLLVGLSIEARDGVSAAQLDASVTQALSAWDANRRMPAFRAVAEQAP